MTLDSQNEKQIQSVLRVWKKDVERQKTFSPMPKLCAKAQIKNNLHESPEEQYTLHLNLI